MLLLRACRLSIGHFGFSFNMPTKSFEILNMLLSHGKSFFSFSEILIPMKNEKVFYFVQLMRYQSKMCTFSTQSATISPIILVEKSKISFNLNLNLNPNLNLNLNSNMFEFMNCNWTALLKLLPQEVLSFFQKSY